MIKRLFLAIPAVVLSLTAGAQGFEASSTDINSNTPIAQKFAFNSFGCTGDNLSPAIYWENAPTGTKSFAVMVHDPDAPTGGAGFWHWVVVDIPASSLGLAQGIDRLEPFGFAGSTSRLQ